MRFLTTEDIGRTRSRTPQGYLVCWGAPIARTGMMLYAAGEVPVEPGPDGIIRVTRDEAELFDPDTLASFEGLPITVGHPEEWVTPENWRQLAHGYGANIRQGVGEQSDLMLADLFITDPATIKRVESGDLPEISNGYDSEYESTGQGRGRQYQMRGNHIAFVEQGRCGSRCAVGDEATVTMKRATPMAKRTWRDRLRTAFKAQDEAALEEALQEAQEQSEATGEPQRVVIEVQAATANVVSEEETKDAVAKVGDQAAFNDSFQRALDALTSAVQRLSDKKTADENMAEGETNPVALSTAEIEADADEAAGERTVDSGETVDTIARAEILVPGIKLPTLDTKTSTKDTLCAFRRKVLGESDQDVISTLTGNKTTDFSKLTCDATKSLFIAASEIKKRDNNSTYVRPLTIDTTAAGLPTVNDIAQRNRDFWARK